MSWYYYQHRGHILALTQRPDGRWLFTYAGETVGSWHSARSAIDDIQGGHSGNHDWDFRSDTHEVSDDPGEWTTRLDEA